MKFLFPLFAFLIWTLSCSSKDKETLKTPEAQVQGEVPKNVPKTTPRNTIVLQTEEATTKPPILQQTKSSELQQEEPPLKIPDTQKIFLMSMISGYYQQELDFFLKGGFLNFWRSDILARVVLAYLQEEDVLLVVMKSLDPEQRGSFCLLLGDFEASSPSSDTLKNTTVYNYKAQHHLQIDDFETPIGNTSTVLRDIQIVVQTDTKQLKRVGLTLSDKIRRTSQVVMLSGEHHEKREESMDSQTFFQEWKSSSSCR